MAFAPPFFSRGSFFTLLRNGEIFFEKHSHNFNDSVFWNFFKIRAEIFFGFFARSAVKHFGFDVMRE